MRGLLHGMQQHITVESSWLDINQGLGQCWQSIRALPKGSVVAGTGRLTWRYLLLAKLIFGLKTIVLSSPKVWPLAWFDFVVSPRHDGLMESGRILCSEGVLSPMMPAEAPDPERGLILVGGPSNRYGWDEAAILRQIQTLVARTNKRWRLTNSRRTPPGLLDQIEALSLHNVEIFAVEDTPPHWVRDNLLASSTAWVTEDSMSMVFEALSAGIQVGLLAVPRLGQGRVTESIDSLLQRRWVTGFEEFEKTNVMLSARPPLQEASRVAGIIAERLGIA